MSPFGSIAPPSAHLSESSVRAFQRGSGTWVYVASPPISEWARYPTADEPTHGKLVPTDIDKEPIIWRGNPAHMDGRLTEFGLWLKRTGFLKLKAKSRQEKKVVNRNGVRIFRRETERRARLLKDGNGTTR